MNLGIIDIICLVYTMAKNATIFKKCYDDYPCSTVMSHAFLTSPLEYRDFLGS